MIQVLADQGLTAFLVAIIALVLALSWHEAAHALVAKWLGDHTAELLGRLTLNPLAHLDPIGTVALLLAGVGWGKPVPVNPSNFNNPKLDNLKVSLAGPFSNFVLALLFAGLNWLFRPDPHSVAGAFTGIVIWFNLVLMLFNLIPVPPLDGSKIVHLFLSEEAFLRFERYGFYLLFILILLSFTDFPLLSYLIFTPARQLFQYLTHNSLIGLF